MDGTELMPVKAKRYGPGRLIVVTHRFKRKHHLGAVLRPVTSLVDVVFADVEGGKSRAPVGGKTEGKNPFRRISRRSVTLVDPRHLPLRGEKRYAAGRNEPTQRQQTTRKEGVSHHAE